MANMVKYMITALIAVDTPRHKVLMFDHLLVVFVFHSSLVVCDCYSRPMRVRERPPVSLLVSRGE